MLKLKRIRLIFLIAILAMTQRAYSQAQFIGEIGLRAGCSYYNGDLNSTTLFRHLKSSGGAFIRFNLTDYLGLKIDGGFAGIKGSGKNYPKNHLPEIHATDEAGGYVYQFDKRIFNLDMVLCINFFKFSFYNYDHDAKWHTPYVMFGPCMAVMSEWSGKESRGGICWGVGYKFKIGPRVNAGVEWTMHKLFKDDLDRNGGFNYLDDPYGIGHKTLKNNDYYSMCLLFISVDILKKRGICR